VQRPPAAQAQKEALDTKRKLQHKQEMQKAKL
jgi:hypothetical protein